MLYTDDPLGMTGWKDATISPAESKPRGMTVFDYSEPCPFVRPDGVIVSAFRNISGYLYASTSRDNGVSWSVPQITNFPDAQARHATGTLPDGTTFIINNPGDGKEGYRPRPHLTIALSHDGIIQLAYHNHTFEFDPMDGTRAGYDVLMEEFSADMLFEVDAFWVHLGKRDPAKLIRSLKGRVTQVHLKDLAAGIKLPEKIEGWWSLPVEAFAPLGDGIIPVNPIIEAAKEAGVQYCHVEQDLSHDPMASIRRSLGYLRA